MNSIVRGVLPIALAVLLPAALAVTFWTCVLGKAAARRRLQIPAVVVAHLIAGAFMPVVGFTYLYLELTAAEVEPPILTVRHDQEMRESTMDLLRKRALMTFGMIVLFAPLVGLLIALRTEKPSEVLSE